MLGSIRNGVTSRAQEAPPHLQAPNVGPMATRWARLTHASLATPVILATKRRPLGMITWEAVRPTRNDVSGWQLKIIKQGLKSVEPHPFLNNMK
jgi:hypothetical protein